MLPSLMDKISSNMNLHSEYIKAKVINCDPDVV